MKVYVFGNEDEAIDSNAIKAASKLKTTFAECEFVFVKPNEDLPFADEERVIILDNVQGINSVELFEDFDPGKLINNPRGSVHDFDLGFQLKYLKKLGKLGEVVLIAVPMDGEPDYLRIQSILRKLVAQDMQGS